MTEKIHHHNQRISRDLRFAKFPVKTFSKIQSHKNISENLARPIRVAKIQVRRIAEGG